MWLTRQNACVFRIGSMGMMVLFFMSTFRGVYYEKVEKIEDMGC